MEVDMKKETKDLITIILFAFAIYLLGFMSGCEFKTEMASRNQINAKLRTIESNINYMLND
jgi:hypothetical protein